MSKHTPGPWSKRYDEMNGCYEWTILKLAGDNTQTVATAYERGDARLISAAPDLLEACEQTIAAGLRHNADGGTPETLALKAQAWNAMRAAIAKATGE